MINAVCAFFSVLIVSLISLVGTFFLSLKEATLKKYVHFFISLAIGALLGDAFIHLIPESFEEIPNTSVAGLFIIIGIIIFFIIERFLHWHHHGEEEDKEHHHVQPVGKLILITDGFHNLIDGIIIGVSFLTSIPLGIATTLAVVLHEIPQEIGDFAVLIHSGYSRKRALFLNFLSALTAMIGLILAITFGQIAENLTHWILPIAAGGFIYIAVADLIPELKQSEKNKTTIFTQMTAIAIGIFLMISLIFLE
jgi:zinc and cadmium transporter